MRIYGLLSLLVGLVACATVDIDSASVPALKEGRSVEIGRDAEATVGSVVYSEYNYYASYGAVTRAPFATPVGLNKVVVPAGSRLVKATVDKKPAYCTLRPAFFALGEARSICLFDTLGSGILNKFYVAGSLASLQYDAAIPYTEEEMSSDSVGYKYELLYQGIAGDVAKMSYREYTNNFARPAFQQDLSYTLSNSGPSEVSFRGVRIDIVAADNNRIRYRVMSGFVR